MKIAANCILKLKNLFLVFICNVLSLRQPYFRLIILCFIRCFYLYLFIAAPDLFSPCFSLFYLWFLSVIDYRCAVISFNIDVDNNTDSISTRAQHSEPDLAFGEIFDLVQSPHKLYFLNPRYFLDNNLAYFFDIFCFFIL